ncbi:MAG: copper oxidase [Thermoanaerobaculia bacterium]
MRTRYLQLGLALLVAATAGLGAAAPVAAQADGFASLEASGSAAFASNCQRQLTASVVALDQVFFWNRLGAFEPQGMMYALERDVVNVGQDELNCASRRLPLVAGQVKLRKDKRPRPLVLRMNVGDCLTIKFTNLLANAPVDDEQPATRMASIHVQGLEYVSSVADGGLNVGLNATGGVVAPGQTTYYQLFARAEGTYLMYSGGAMVGGGGDGGSIADGLFGAVNVQPTNTEWYRSQVTQRDLARAITNGYPGSAAYPLINYNATYPAGNEYCFAAGTPVLKMLQATSTGGLEILYSDLTAIITGPDHGFLPVNSYPNTPNNIYVDRLEPYREFTIIFHDEIQAVQAFPHFQDRLLQHTLHSARDAFAINYGTGGAGAEVLANRIGVGPMWNCVECKYEEFFLTSWAVGDPAMVVDVPANFPCTVQQLKDGVNCVPQPGPKATKALYPDDPSNVYHSYLNDNVKFRNLHAGVEDHHIFHLHAHQWLHTPNSDQSAYHDSQAIGQGSAFTYEIAYGGSGNRPKTVGDSIFHCHFYPHFAQGMWSLWRVHDVLETGTVLDDKGRPAWLGDANGNVTTITRALPDGEIRYGTPIPALVPLPGLPMAPAPGPVQLRNGDIYFAATPATSPGYPFFVPGKGGHRPPSPPLDLIDNGGLGRHVIVGGTAASEQNRLSMAKDLLTAQASFLNELGTKIEKVAMSFHEVASYNTPKPDSGVLGLFKTNGLPRIRGAPFADPCNAADGALLPPRTYKAADIQMDMVFNKVGWHFPQQRLITLWDDVVPTLYARRPPEPFFFRANSRECIEFQLTNLTPNEYLLDDFEVRTPTDIIGQHIHLVKFDVLASDGGGNGFNYEDGTMSAEEVQERIRAIRAFNSCLGGVTGGDPRDGTDACPVAVAHPYFTPRGIDADCDGVDDWLGARTSVQRWWADPVRDNNNVDRTLHTVFTHDHFGPSTHQQVGLYAGLVIEKEGSSWFHNETNVPLGTRTSDGGPTSWQARIEGPDSFREFLLEFADFQHAYEPNQFGPLSAGSLQLSCPDTRLGFFDNVAAVNPPNREELPPPTLYDKAQQCPINLCDPDGTVVPATGLAATRGLPCPEAFSAADPGTGVVNYRNESIALRAKLDGQNLQNPTEAGDLSFIYETRTDRSIALLNDLAPNPLVPYPPLTTGLFPGDPFTPLMRVHEGDRVKVRTLVGAHEEEHTQAIHGAHWLFEPNEPDSGFRSSQMAGISEYFDFELGRMPSLGIGESADFLYKPSNSVDFQWNGVWGLIRLYRGATTDLTPINANPDALVATDDATTFRPVTLTRPQDTGDTSASARRADGSFELATEAATATITKPVLCPRGAPLRHYDVVAVWAQEALPQGTLVYNSRKDVVYKYQHASGLECDSGSPWVITDTKQGPLHDPTAILFLLRQDWDPVTGHILPGRNIEPLVLRALPGECVEVSLYNSIGIHSPVDYADLDGWAGVPMIVEGFNQNEVDPSMDVGLHPQLVAYDVRLSDGTNVGRNRATFFNYKQTVAPSQTVTYHWYTGTVSYDSLGNANFQPVEFGAVPLSSSDPIKHSNKGAIGALIVEPLSSSWLDATVTDVQTGLSVVSHAQAQVTTPSGSFREFVAFYQDDVNQRYSDGTPVPNLAVSKDATESGQGGFNYRAEPIWFRAGWAPETQVEFTRTFTGFADIFRDSFVGARPQTPIVSAVHGTPARFRVIHAAGDTQNQVFEVTGHIFQEEACLANSTVLGFNARSNWAGSQPSMSAGRKADLLFDACGGLFGISQEHLYKTYVPWSIDEGMWGLFNVQ